MLHSPGQQKGSIHEKCLVVSKSCLSLTELRERIFLGWFCSFFHLFNQSLNIYYQQGLVLVSVSFYNLVKSPQLPFKNCCSSGKAQTCAQDRLPDGKYWEKPCSLVFTQLCVFPLPAPSLAKVVWNPTKAMSWGLAPPPNQKIYYSLISEKKSQSHNWLCIAGILVRGANKETFQIFHLFWVRFCSYGLAECHLKGSDFSWGQTVLKVPQKRVFSERDSWVWKAKKAVGTSQLTCDTVAANH